MNTMPDGEIALLLGSRGVGLSVTPFGASKDRPATYRQAVSPGSMPSVFVRAPLDPPGPFP